LNHTGVPLPSALLEKFESLFDSRPVSSDPVAEQVKGYPLPLSGDLYSGKDLDAIALAGGEGLRIPGDRVVIRDCDRPESSGASEIHDLGRTERAVRAVGVNVQVDKV
jgi:hypothetical protein